MSDREGERLGYVVAIVTIWWVWTVSPWHSFHHIEPLSLSPLSLSLYVYSHFCLSLSFFPSISLISWFPSRAALPLFPSCLASSSSPFLLRFSSLLLQSSRRWRMFNVKCAVVIPSLSFWLSVHFFNHPALTDPSVNPGPFQKKEKEKKKRGGENSIRTARRAEQKLDWYLSANLLERLTSSVITI